MNGALLYSAWRKTCDAEPEAPALVGPVHVTRRELDEEVSRNREALKQTCEVKGFRVALAERDRMQWLVRFLALVGEGAIPVLLDANDTKERLMAAARHLKATGGWIEGSWHWFEGERPRRDRRHALVKVTSGSTGDPKGFAFTAAMMLADGRNLCDVIGLTARDINYAILPLGHSYGLGNLVMPLLMKGVPFYSGTMPLPQVMAEEILNSRATVVPLVPDLVRALCDTEVGPSCFSSVRCVISAGALLRPTLALRFHELFSLPVSTLYGSSETGSIAFDREGGAAENEEGVVGTLLPTVQVTLGRGGRLEVTSEAAMGKGRVRLQDRVKQLPGGALKILGRQGRLVKVGGRRLDLSGLESEFSRIPGVLEVALEIDPQAPERVVGFFVGKERGLALRKLLSSHVPSWKLPARILTLAALPRTERGKVDRLALRSLALRGTAPN